MDKLRSIFSLLVEHWQYVVGFFAALSGLFVLINNYYSIVNLRLQNKEYKKSSGEVFEKINYQILPDLGVLLFSIEGNDIKTSDVLLQEIGISLTKEEVYDLLYREIKSHPILIGIDYESLPVSLKNGYFAVLSRQSSSIYLEAIYKANPNTDTKKLWTDMSENYFIAYRLPFRFNSSVLANETEYKKTLGVLKELMHSSYSFYVAISCMKYPDSETDREALSRLHSLNNRVTGGIGNGVYEYGEKNRDYLKKTTLHFDSAISSAHKILIEYKIPNK